MKLFFAADHAGFELKNVLMEFAVTELGHEVEDCGAFSLDEGDDYPDFIKSAVGHMLESSDESRAIVLGGSGQGEAMCANRFPGVRATVYYGGSEDIITLSRQHNDANVLSLGARFVSEDEAKTALQTWLETDFSGDERHVRRLSKLENS